MPFEATERQQERSKLLPPMEPVRFPFRNAATIWNGLYGDNELADRPRFCILYLSPSSISIDDTLKAETANIDMLNDKNINEAVLQPLMALLSDMYETYPALCLTDRGEMWAMSRSDAVECISRGSAPGSRIVIPSLFEGSWYFASKFSSVEYSQNPIVKSIGLMLFGIFFALFALAVGVLIKASYVVGETAERLFKYFDAGGSEVFYITAFIGLFWQFLNLLFFFPPARKFSIGLILINCIAAAITAYFSTYSTLETVLIAVVGALALNVPVFLIVYSAGVLMFLSPILTWLPNQIRKTAVLSLNRYQLEKQLAEYDYQQRVATNIRVIKKETRYLT